MTQQEAIEKALKLLRLSKSPVPAEAALAAAKAQEIIDKFQLDVENLDFDKQQQERDQEEIQDFGQADPLDVAKYGQYRETWMLRLACAVAKANQVKVVYFTDWKKNRTMTCIGRPSDVHVVRYLYGFFKLQVEEMASRCCKGHSGAYRGHFCVGVIDTLQAKLREQRQQTFGDKRQEVAGNQMALVRVNNAIAKLDKRMTDVEEWTKTHLDLGKARASSFKVSTGGRYHGQQEGRNIRMTSAKGSLGSNRKAIN